MDDGQVTHVGQVTREALYDLVWSKPMLKVADQFGVSSSYMARVCTLLHVPRPERSYWAKLAVGRAPNKPPLPDARPGDHLAWTRDGEMPLVHRVPPKPPSLTTRRRSRRVAQRPTQHHLLVGAKPLFEGGRLTYSADYLKPSKRLLVDLVVTKTGIDKALTFANELFLALEDCGYRVVIAPTSESFHRADVDEREASNNKSHYNNLWYPARCTVVYVGTVALGLTIIEMSEEVEVRYINGKYIRLSEYSPQPRRRNSLDHSWTSTRELTTERLCLQAYSPYPLAIRIYQWRETKGRDLTSRIKTIIKELEQAAVEVARLAEEGARQAEIERQKFEEQWKEWDRKRQAEREAKAIQDSKEELLNIINAWSNSVQLQAFFANAEEQISHLPEHVRDEMLERLRQARDLVGSTDALERFRLWRSPQERLLQVSSKSHCITVPDPASGPT